MFLLNQPHFLPLTWPLDPGFLVETLLEQGSGERNEDVLLQGDSLFGVFDGATSLDKRTFADNQTGGLLAARLAAATFREGNDSLAYLADLANRRIRRSLLTENVCLSERHRLWSTSLAVVRIGDDRLEYCQTGDAQILLLFDDGSCRAVAPQTDIDRETLQLWKESQAPEAVTIHDLLARQIHRVRLQMNRSYGVLNGEPEAMHFLRHGYEDLDGVSDVLLFTDGLFLPRENPLADEEWQKFADLYRTGGLHRVHHHVRRLQRDDPACRRYPRFKQHDDIAAVAIRLQNTSQPAIALS